MEELEKSLSEEDRRWYVYMHINKINNKKYIGITQRSPEDRWGNNGCKYNMEHQPVFARAIQKYGWNNFEHIVVANQLLECEAKAMEMELIFLYKTNCCKYKDPTYGYNMTDGGEGSLGRVLSEETKEKMSKIAKERLKNPENHPMYGKNFTEEWKQKISKTAKERLKNPLNNPMYGKAQSEKTKQAVSMAQSKAVIQLTKQGEFIAEYVSGVQAERVTNILCGGISNCCTGKSASAGGFLWIFKSEYNPLYVYSYEERKLFCKQKQVNT